MREVLTEGAHAGDVFEDSREIVRQLSIHYCLPEEIYSSRSDQGDVQPAFSPERRAVTVGWQTGWYRSQISSAEPLLYSIYESRGARDHSHLARETCLFRMLR